MHLNEYSPDVDSFNHVFVTYATPEGPQWDKIIIPNIKRTRSQQFAVASAKTYKYIIDTFIKHILQWDVNTKKATGISLYGKIKAFIMGHETQNDTSLHCHAIL